MDIFLDESGFNGVDLLGTPSSRPEDDSRAFVLATIAIPEEECKQLKVKHFGKVQAPSLKHSRLARNPSRQAMVIGFLEELVRRPGQVKIYAAHKRFCLVRKLVDLVVEKVYRDDGQNLYQDRADVILATLIYYLIPKFEGRAYLDNLLAAFQVMMRSRTQSGFNAFATTLVSKTLRQESRQLLAPVFEFVRRYDAGSFFEPAHKNALDLSFGCAQAVMSVWRGELDRGVPICLIHDQSSNMAKQSGWWEFLNHPDRPEYVEVTSHRIVFPAGIDETRFEKDEDWAGIQLADVAAGAVHRASSWSAKGQDPGDGYGRALMRITENSSDGVILPMWPDEDVLTGKLSLAGQDASRSLDYIVERAVEFRAGAGVF